jgi:hypothetical protein
LPQGETLKLQEDGIKKGSQNKAGINLKTCLSLQGMSRKTPCTSRPAGRDLDRKYAKSVERKQQTLPGKPQLY